MSTDARAAQRRGGLEPARRGRTVRKAAPSPHPAEGELISHCRDNLPRPLIALPEGS